MLGSQGNSEHRNASEKYKLYSYVTWLLLSIWSFCCPYIAKTLWNNTCYHLPSLFCNYVYSKAWNYIAISSIHSYRFFNLLSRMPLQLHTPARLTTLYRSYCLKSYVSSFMKPHWISQKGFVPVYQPIPAYWCEFQLTLPNTMGMLLKPQILFA